MLYAYDILQVTCVGIVGLHQLVGAHAHGGVELLQASRLGRSAHGEGDAACMCAQRVSFDVVGAQQYPYCQCGQERPYGAQHQQHARVALALVEQRIEGQQQQQACAHAAHDTADAHRLVVAAAEPAAAHQYQYVQRNHQHGVFRRVVFRAAPFHVLPHGLDEHKAAVGQQEVGQRHRHALCYALYPRQRGAQPDGHLQQQVEQPRILAAEVFAHKDSHGVVECIHVVHRALAGALAFVVYDACGGQIVVLPARQLDVPRVVDVLAVHEVGLVQAANLVVHLAAQHKKRAGKYLYLVDVILAEMPHVVGGEALGVREQACESADLVE